MSETADFLVELGTEELPPKALKNLSNAFAEGIKAGLLQARLDFDNDSVEVFATPRRLAVLVHRLECQQADQKVEKLGPAIAAAYDDKGNPSKAALGFARSNNVEFDQLEKIETDKGERLCYRSINPGLAAEKLLPEIVSKALAELPVPKRMRWGASRTEFVRPAHWLVMLLGDQVVEADVLGLSAGNISFGHRFHAPESISIPNASAYEITLESQGKLVPSFARRRKAILQQVEQLASRLGGKAVVEEDLLDEVTALVEFPVALAGQFDGEFLRVPKEALVYSMSEHQKYFHVVDGEDNLLPYFIAVSNIDCEDPSRIVSGNERVIRPRLADAAFFFETDKKVSLNNLRERLKNVVFQQKLGTVFDKTERIARLAEHIAKLLDAETAAAKLAGELCKADLASDLVLEFDKMQGVAGGYYADNEGLGDTVAYAIKSHYQPRFAGDEVPTSKEASAVAIADRLDTITGIFGIGQQPSGSRDPFALRRASIGILQIVLQNKLVLNLRELVEQATCLHNGIEDKAATVDKVCEYIFDRFTALYQEQGVATEVILAVRAVSRFDALDFDARIKAVAEFVQQPECESLAAANKRVGNILEKSADSANANTFDSALLVETAEQALAAALSDKRNETGPLYAGSNYRQGLLALTSLRQPIDSFFDQVMVNADDPALKQNRLALLAQLRDLFTQVADIALLVPAKK